MSRLWLGNCRIINYTMYIWHMVNVVKRKCQTSDILGCMNQFWILSLQTMILAVYISVTYYSLWHLLYMHCWMFSPWQQAQDLEVQWEVMHVLHVFSLSYLSEFVNSVLFTKYLFQIATSVRVVRTGVPTGYRSNPILLKAPFLLIILGTVSLGGLNAMRLEKLSVVNGHLFLYYWSCNWLFLFCCSGHTNGKRRPIPLSIHFFHERTMFVKLFIGNYNRKVNAYKCQLEVV